MENIAIKREEATDYISEMIADDFFNENEPGSTNLIITPSKLDREEIIDKIYKAIKGRVPKIFKDFLNGIICHNGSTIKFRNDEYERYIYANSGSLTSICGIGGVRNLIFYDVLQLENFIDIFASALPTIMSNGKVYIIDDKERVDKLKVKMSDAVNFIELI